MKRVLFTCSAGGLGHITRSLSVAKHLRDLDEEVQILFAGEGPGLEFVDMNNFKYKEIPQPKFFTSQGPQSDIKKIIKPFLKNNKKYRDLFKKFKPDLHFCDMEIFSLFLGNLFSVYNILLSHELDPFDFGMNFPNNWLRNKLIVHKERLSDYTFYPLAFKENKELSKGRVVDPLAYEDIPIEYPNDFEKKVLVIPSGAGGIDISEVERVAKKNPDIGFYVRKDGENRKNLRYVEKVPNLFPWIKGADLLLCSGYSSIMESTVAGTPCVIIPKTSEQNKVARLCEDSEIALTSNNLSQGISYLGRKNKLEEVRDNMKELENGAEEIARFIDQKLKEL